MSRFSKETPCALEYFHDNFDEFWAYSIESELKDSDEQTRNWCSDYLDLMEHRRNPNYGRKVFSLPTIPICLSSLN